MPTEEEEKAAREQAAADEMKEADRNRTPQEGVRNADKIYRQERGEDPPGARRR